MRAVLVIIVAVGTTMAYYLPAIAQTSPTPISSVTWTIGNSEDGQTCEYVTVAVPDNGYAVAEFANCNSYIFGPLFPETSWGAVLDLYDEESPGSQKCSGHLRNCCKSGNSCSGSYVDFFGVTHRYEGTCSVSSC